MADWEEIKKLAADFQRTQTSDTLQRLSDRSCIDIVKKLIELNLIELIYTCDGKEYITPEHLRKEIEDEVYINGGRMHLNDLAAKLKVDYQHVENKSKELAKDRPDEYSLILGQLIHSTYKITLGKQINDFMLMTGQLSIAEFAKSLDLPSEFLLTIVKEMLPKIMDPSDFVVSQDERTYYTSDMMDRYKAIITGTLIAITKPSTIASLMKRLNIPERIFLPIVDGLIKEGRVDASVENRLFIPAVYAREQNDWINKFYSSNSYIEYDVLSRMDIKQPKTFLKKRFPDGIALKTCFISQDLLSQVESLIEDSIQSNGFLDISTIVPSAIESDDIEQIIQDILKKNKQFSSSCLIFDRTNICSLGYVEICKSRFSNMMQSRAQDDLKEGKLINHFMGGKLKEKPKIESIQAKENVAELEKVEAPCAETPISMKSPVSETKEIEIKDTELKELDDEQGGKKGKGRKSGGGLVGREIRQKAVKKKYVPGNKGNQKNADLSDDELAPTKGPRSNKGRAARRREISPSEYTPMVQKSQKSARSKSPIRKEPLIFMSTEELVNKLRIETRNLGDCSDEFYESIAKTIEDDLNKSYQTLAKQTLDEHLKAQANEEQDPSKCDEIDLVE